MISAKSSSIQTTYSKLCQKKKITYKLKISLFVLNFKIFTLKLDICTKNHTLKIISFLMYENKINKNNKLKKIHLFFH